jgi:NADH-quinone oxidoreductase subunit M
MKELGGLGSKMPVWSTFMVFFVMASVGLPGLNGFVSEFMCMLAAFQASDAWGSGVWGSLGNRPVGATAGNLGPWFGIIAGTGVIIAAMYLLYMTGNVVWGKLKLPADHHGHHGHDSHASGALPTDLNTREIAILTPLAVLCVLLGMYPKPILTLIEQPVQNTVLVVNGMDVPVVPAPKPTSTPTGRPANAVLAQPKADPAVGDASQNQTVDTTRATKVVRAEIVP